VPTSTYPYPHPPSTALRYPDYLLVALLTPGDSAGPKELVGGFNPFE